MTESAPISRFQISPDYSVSRIIVGGWQFSQGHGAGMGSGRAVEEYFSALVDGGLTTFDCADIYTGVEELFGSLLKRRRASGNPSEIQIHTKFVPDLDALPTLDRAYVERIIHRSLTRLDVERLDLVQFHWWDFAVPGYVEVMHWLGELQREGKIRLLGVTNFDEDHLREVVDSGVEVVSNQVQYSALDRRPAEGLVPYCREEGIVLLCYGGLSGGFLTESYLGLPDPGARLANRSLVKYHLIIHEIGGWDRYQAVLATLHAVARRKGVSIPCVALRYVLDRPNVAATITGLDSLAQVAETRKALDLELDAQDVAELDETLREIPPPPGPVYGLERDRDGPHGAIMRYNLNQD